MTPPRLTTHQKWTLMRLRRLSSVGGLFAPAYAHEFVLGKDVGAPAALEHLVRKGYVEREVQYGPRGGEHRLYRPTHLGTSVSA